MKKKWGGNRRKSFCSEMWENVFRVLSGVGGGLMKILWGSPCVTVRQKLLNAFG